MFNYYIILIICFLLGGCCCIKEEASNPGNTPLVMSFEVKSQKECIDIKESRGSSVLGLFVQKNGTVKDFNILQLRVIKELSDTLIDYAKMKSSPLSYNDYPEKVKLYYPLFKEYVDSLILKPREEVNVDDENYIYLKVKIGCD